MKRRRRLRRGRARHNVQVMYAYDPQALRQTREGLSYTQHFTAPGIYPGLEDERAVARKRSGR